MVNIKNQLPPSKLILTTDVEVIRHLEQAITNGKHWYIALLEAIGQWKTAEEIHKERAYRYLIAIGDK